MQKQPMSNKLKKINRGLILTIITVVILIVYLVVSQLLLVSAKDEIKEVTNKFHDIIEKNIAMSSKQVQQLGSVDGVEAFKANIKDELSKIFEKDSHNIDVAVDTLTLFFIENVNDGEIIEEVKHTQQENYRNSIIEDVSRIEANYQYTASGKFFEYGNEDLSAKHIDDAKLDVSFTLLLKQVDGAWKIFHVGECHWYKMETEEEQNVQLNETSKTNEAATQTKQDESTKEQTSEQTLPNEQTGENKQIQSQNTTIQSNDTINTGVQ